MNDMHQKLAAHHRCCPGARRRTRSTPAAQRPSIAPGGQGGFTSRITCGSPARRARPGPGGKSIEPLVPAQNWFGFFFFLLFFVCATTWIRRSSGYSRNRGGGVRVGLIIAVPARRCGSAARAWLAPGACGWLAWTEAGASRSRAGTAAQFDATAGAADPRKALVGGRKHEASSHLSSIAGGQIHGPCQKAFLLETEKIRGQGRHLARLGQGYPPGVGDPRRCLRTVRLDIMEERKLSRSEALLPGKLSWRR